MISSVAELCAVALSSALQPALLDGDWYLVGSRTTGDDDELSDWDTLLITESVEGEQPPQSLLDTVFGISRPTLVGPPDLDFHVAWRSVAAVDLEVITPAVASQRAGDLSTWAFELEHAQLLHRGTGAGERHRAVIADRFAAESLSLARRAYGDYRLARNQAVSALARRDAATEIMLGGRCVYAAARTWFLAGGHPAPGPKWILPALGRRPDGPEFAALLRDALDPTAGPAVRFDVHLAIWDRLDRHVAACGVPIEVV